MGSEIRYASHPGIIIKEAIEELGLSQTDFANRTGLLLKTVSTLISCESSITFDIAVKIGKFFDNDPEGWINLQTRYNLYVNAKLLEEELLEEWEIASIFNNSKIKQSLNLNISKNNKYESIKELRNKFTVGSLKFLKKPDMYAFCKTAVIKDIDQKTIILRNAWISLAEQKARSIECCEFNKDYLIKSTKEIKKLTKERPNVFLPKLIDILSEGGVKLVILPYLPGSNVGGFTKWNPIEKCSLIAVNDCGKDADKIWFSIFHELGHAVQNHRRHATISFNKNPIQDENEIEANEFAINHLIDLKDYREFIRNNKFGFYDIINFADSQDVAPFIVVGRLQKDGYIGWNEFSNLKVKYEVV